jgi:amidohydrolase
MKRPPAFDQVRPAVHDLFEKLVSTRRHFHEHPELSWKEVQTQKAILERLREIDGLQDIRPIARTGATALLVGSRERPCVLWRADIDALPVPERNDLPFASKNPGVMHACGHDVHITIALGLAEALAARRDELAGSVRFVFQPAEEGSGGAQACIADAVLESPPVDHALGLHISSDIPLGSINVAAGPFFAAPTTFTITITGRGGHAAAPQQSVDAVVTAAYAITALQTVVSRSVSPAETVVLTIGKVEAGYRSNVIADSATLKGTVRTYTDHLRDEVIRRMDEILAGVCSAFGATFTLEHETSCPPLVNDPTVTALVEHEAASFFGHEQIMAVPTMGAEDMSVFLEERPGCYFWLGARNERKGIAGRHHDPAFMIDEDALELGVEFGIRVIEAALRS